MYSNDQVTFQLPDLQDQKLVSLCWCSFSQWGREGVASSSTYKDDQYVIIECPQPMAAQSTEDVIWKIIHGPLMLIMLLAYPQCVIIEFCMVSEEMCFGSHSIVFMYFLFHHYIVL